MCATAHIAVSATLGASKLPLPATTLLSFLLHYLLDLAPHVDEADLFEDGRPRSALATFVLGLDIGFGLALTIPEVQRLKGRRAASKAALCVLAGLLPDVLDNLPAIKLALRRSSIVAKGEALHQRLQAGRWARKVGVLDQIALVLLALRALSVRGRGE